MLSHELLESVNSMLWSISRGQEDPWQGLENLLLKLGKAHDEISAGIAAAVAASEVDGEVDRASYAGALNKAANLVAKVGPRDLFLETARFRESLEFLGEIRLLSTRNTGDSQLQNFERSYERYLQRHQSADLVDLCEISARLYYSMGTMRSLLLAFKEALEGLSGQSVLADREGETEFQLLLDSSLDLDRFAGKLGALDQIYCEISSLVGISSTEFPARVVKIESGSFWAAIRGELKTTSLMKSAIRSATSYLYRNFTREGKIESIPRKIGAIEAILQLRHRLDRAGIDTGAMNEQIGKSSVVVARHLNELLLGEASVTIDGEIISVGAELEQKYLEESKRLLLPEPASVEGAEAADEGT